MNLMTVTNENIHDFSVAIPRKRYPLKIFVILLNRVLKKNFRVGDIFNDKTDMKMPCF